MSARTPVQDFEQRQKIFAGLGLLILVFVSVILNNLHMNTVAEQSTRFISRMIQLQEFREVSLTLQDAKLDSFTEIHYISDRPGRSFDLPAGTSVQLRPGFGSSISADTITVPITDPLNSERSDKIIYTYSKFRLLPYAVAVWFVIVLISIPQSRFMKQRVTDQYERQLSFERDRAQATVAKEVRHNLRSPLAALMRIPARLPDSVKKDRILLTSTINQIKALVASLGQDKEKEFSQKTSNAIYDSIVQSAQELALAVPAEIEFIYEIDDALVSAEVRHIPHELRALLGNIVSNSVDAIQGSGLIKFRVSDLASDIEIEIKDSGRGIPEEIIEKIFDDGFSAKRNGQGMGLFHAKRWIESWEGSISAESFPDEMTRITIRLPIDERTSWYVPRIRVEANQPVFVVEDQESARELWRLRFEEAGLTQVNILPSAAAFRRNYSEFQKSDGPRAIYFFDYDLGSGRSGLDLFAELPADSEKYLVTGHFDDASIRAACEKSGIFLIPKSQVPDIPIVLV